MTEQARLGAAIKTRARYLGNEIAAGDDAGILNQSIHIADLATRLAVSVGAPVPIEEKVALREVDSGWFTGSEGDVPYIVGGSPDNPNGVSFSVTTADAWWTYVFSHGVNYSGVRSTLLPGSHVLTPEGIAATAALLRSENLIDAPEDFNPLNLEVIA